MTRRILSIPLILLLLVGPVNLAEVVGSNVDQETVYKVKAGLLYHLSSLVTWPGNGAEGHKAPIILGFVGEEPQDIAEFFEQEAPSTTPKGRKLITKRIPPVGPGSSVASLSDFGRELRQCHLIYVSGIAQPGQSYIFNQLRNTSVLTVSETESFLDDGGMVSFLVRKGRVMVFINLDAVQRADLKISAQLLQHATIVTDR